VDCNGDGKIDGNVEQVFARGQEIIFRVGTRYVSTKSVDIKTGDVLIADHPASDYKRIECYVGATVPEFLFQDFDGRPHKISEYRGKYVLLQFWGTW
jgi:hypothetical protein